MSGVVKGVKKVFKKVGTVVKKILPYALPIAAGLFTIGGMFGVAGMAGGWSGAIGKLAGTSTLGKILGGAVTQAGYGGLIGGGIGAITGGKKGAIKGLGIGQMVGAATGAATGAMGAFSTQGATTASSATQPGMGAGSPPGAVPGASTQGLRGTQAMSSYGNELPGQYAASPNQTGLRQALQPVQSGAIQTGAAQQVTRAAQTLPSAGMVPGAMAAPSTGMSAAGTGNWWDQQNPIVQASMITAGAQALPAVVGAMTKSDEDENQQLAVEEARRKAINQNFSGLSLPKPAPLSTLRAAPRYAYDETAGRIVLKYG